ncbi:flavin reductase family protein [Variovorax ureilyticus]|uniref:flavin reductase family protein n=1 Tax=Variovorax ureilyticus TaxID=1836198 RepID=UPI003D675669
MTPDGKREGMTINSFASVSLDPPLILWSIRDDTRSADAFLASRSFNLSVLGCRAA